MLNRRFLVLLAAAGALAACGSTTSPSSSASLHGSAPATSGSGSSPSGTAPPGTTPPTRPFVSKHYRYSVASTDWTGTDAKTTWDGAGSPGDGDPTVDVLEGPQGERAFAFGEPTKKTLGQFVAAFRKANSTVHPYPTRPAATRATTVGGEPALMDEMHCPVPGGPFVVNAITIHDGRAYVVFTYSIPAGSEAFTKAWFGSLLSEIAFDAPVTAA